MRSTCLPVWTLVLAAGLILVVSPVSGSPGIQATLGDKIPLAGYSYGSPWVYLFLTGPNLPVNGVALNNIAKRADEGGFTVVDVDGNDHWTYTWNTASVGGRLDEGTYTIWVANGPNDRSRLAEADYSTISVTLGEPFIAVNTPALPGSMDLRSVPDGASVVVNGEYQGKTPLTIGDLPAGIYNVTFSRFGFVELTTPVRVEAEAVSQVNATLLPRTGSLVVNTSPPGAGILVDGVRTGSSPVTLVNMTADNHTLVVEKEGFSTVSRQVRVIAGQTVTTDIVLEPQSLPPTTAKAAAGAMMPVAGIFLAFLIFSSVSGKQKR